MENSSETRHVTRIHIELAPSDPVESALHEFINDDEQKLHIFTGARRIVNTTEAHTHVFRERLAHIEKALAMVAHNSIFLSGNTRFIPRKDGGGRLFIEPMQPDRLTNIVGRMNGIASLEGVSDTGLLYVDFSSQSLKEDILERRRAFNEKAKDPSTRERFYVGSPHLVTLDIPQYKIRGRPLNEVS